MTKNNTSPIFFFTNTGWSLSPHIRFRSKVNLKTGLSIIRIFFLGVIFWFTVSCDDDFLDSTEKQPTVRSTKALYITPTTGYMEHTVTVPNAGNNVYSIGLLPKWLVFKHLKGSFTDNSATLKFTVQNVSASFAAGTYESELNLVIENVGVYTIPVYFVNE